MSFKSWYDGYPDTTEYVTGMRDAYEAGRAESEAELRAPMDCNHPRACWIEPDRVAQISAGHDKGVVHGGCCSSCAEIATLQADLTKAVRLAADYGIERDALQAERDALREALAGVGAAHLNAPLLSGCLCDWCKVTRNLLSTPASGEPARKP